MATLALTYVVRGDIGGVRLPEERKPARTDGLWQHTCFEAFVRVPRSTAYWEFNLSPSREWATYRFDGYREGMAAEQAIDDPRIDVQSDRSELRVSTKLHVPDVPALAASEDWQLAIAAIIEDAHGGRSWWALAHPPGKPDFHHRDGFVLALPPEERSIS